MTHPSYSHLPPSTIELALQLARELDHAAEAVGRLATGGSGGPPGRYGGGAAGGGCRAAAKAIAVQHWAGPHRDAFELLFVEEMTAMRSTEERLRNEAEGWAGFWAAATSARNDRLHEEAAARHQPAEAIDP